jgi:hypothetical protein
MVRLAVGQNRQSEQASSPKQPPIVGAHATAFKLIAIGVPGRSEINRSDA